jgi:large subunit ribosomal protein L6
MSRVGKIPVTIPSKIKVTKKNSVIEFDSGTEKREYKLTDGVSAEISDGKIKLSANDNSISNIQMFVGMNRSNINNIISGLDQDFKIVLEVNGVGYKASVDKKLLTLTLGYSHEIYYVLPDGIKASFEKPNLITISGSDKILVGQVSKEIISFRKPEPYKGKGVKIQGKKILRKEGKKK